jgi:hypothetical protein
MGASPAGAAEARQSFSILRGRAGLSPLSQADPTRRESRLAGNAGEVVSGGHPDGVTAGVTATPPDRGVLLGPLRSPVGDPWGHSGVRWVTLVEEPRRSSMQPSVPCHIDEVEEVTTRAYTC